MAQSLEKVFLQKVAQMPQEEIELSPPAQRRKPGKGRKANGEPLMHRRENTQGSNVQAAFYHYNYGIINGPKK